MKTIDIREEVDDLKRKIEAKLEEADIPEARALSTTTAFEMLIPTEIHVMEPSEVVPDEYPYVTEGIIQVKHYDASNKFTGYSTIERCVNTDYDNSFLRVITGKYDRKYPVADY